MQEARTNGIMQRLLENESAFRQFIRRRVGDDVVVEDILQQSFTKAVERSHSLNNEQSVLAWFYQILRHTVADYYRSHGAETRRNEALLKELTISGNHQEPPLDELQATACTCLHGLLPSSMGTMPNSSNASISTANRRRRSRKRSRSRGTISRFVCTEPVSPYGLLWKTLAESAVDMAA
ncbi:MAG TPA: sigma factor [Nitrospira sp.]|nr:sigma factor [Nitrospira sp.]